MSARSAVMSVKVGPLKAARFAGQFRGSLKEWYNLDSKILKNGGSPDPEQAVRGIGGFTVEGGKVYL